MLLEALPYRMDDLTASYSAEYERLCREGGFAVARVDLRGTGSSEGIATDEYPPQEQADLAEVIAWLAAQEWSTGRVGMYGTSYSGFNSIQLAVERPPALGAICAIYATDDRYTDDVHYTGGALRGLDLLDYVLYMAAMTVLPPVPSVFGEGWREEWVRRIEGSEPWLLRWLEEQLDGPYWRHGSLRPGYERIACPTMLVGGWADGYRNNTFRTFEALECPKRLLLGPWSHMSTATSLPGPHIDLVPELVRWFGRWLRDEENGVDDEPPIQVFVRRSTRPEPDLAEVRGVWRSERGWPLERGRDELLRPEPPEGSDEVEIRGRRRDDRLDLVRGPPAVGPAERPARGRRALARLRVGAVRRGRGDPRPREAGRNRHVHGSGRVPLGEALRRLPGRDLGARDARSSEPRAPRVVHRRPRRSRWAVRRRSRSSWTRRRGSSSPVTGSGSRSPASDWPNIWPPPRPGALTLDRAALVLSLPLVEGAPPVPDPPVFVASTGEDTHAAEPAGEQPPVVWEVERDVLGRESRAVIAHGSDYDGEEGARIEERYEGAIGVSTVDPGAAWARATSRYVVRWPEADCATEARLELRSDAEAYHVTVEVIAEELGDGEGVVGIGRRERRFERTIPRRLQ